MRQAIDTARRKAKHSDFHGRLRSLTDKIGVYRKLFYTKAPAFERRFYERKRQRLEALMRQEQHELEHYIENKMIMHKGSVAAKAKQKAKMLQGQNGGNTERNNPLQTERKKSVYDVSNSVKRFDVSGQLPMPSDSPAK